MRYVFLTALRNEAPILPKFVDEFTGMVRAAGIAESCTLYVVDDLSLDASAEILGRWRHERALRVEIISAPTNLGNQGAMFYGLSRVEIGPDDVLVTFDCDGEDDVREIPSILELGAQNPGKMVLIERGRRTESALFKLFFATYKSLFRALTARTVVPNNFLLIPGRYVPAIRRSPLVAVHFAYGALKLNAPYVAVTRDRRPRYGGKSSQNLFMLVSHGMVGLMVFYEIVVAKLFMLLFALGLVLATIFGFALILPSEHVTAHRALLWSAVLLGVGAVGLLGLLISAAVALAFKVSAFNLAVDAAAPPATPTRPAGGDDGQQSAAPSETHGRGAS